MQDIIIIDGHELDTVLAALDTGTADIYRIRVWPNGDGTVKIKINERMWSAPVGRSDD